MNGLDVITSQRCRTIYTYIVRFYRNHDWNYVCSCRNVESLAFKDFRSLLYGLHLPPHGTDDKMGYQDKRRNSETALNLFKYTFSNSCEKRLDCLTSENDCLRAEKQ